MAMKKKAAKKKASSTKGLIFPDVGFHLAVMGALLDAGDLQVAEVEAKLSGLDNSGDRETQRLLAAMERLHQLPLDPAPVARIQRLDFDGGNEIYLLLESGADLYTGGEDDTYALRSLAGIQALAGLQALNLDGHGYRPETLDLGPLASHAALVSVRLSGPCSGASALETLPKLKTLKLHNPVDDPAVLDRLAARGVDVQR